MLFLYVPEQRGRLLAPTACCPKVDWQRTEEWVPRPFAGSSTQHPDQEERLKDGREQGVRPVYFPPRPSFKKSVPLMRYSRKLLFYIFPSTTFVRGWLLMPCPVLIHTSQLINYSVYPLIRRSDRVSPCFWGFLWGAARYQARKNAQELTLKQCDFPRLVDFRSNKHLVGISYGDFFFFF